MRKLLSCLLGVIIFTSNAYGDFLYENYPLGMSKASLHDQLASDKFYFSEVSENTIKAKKYVLGFYSLDLKRGDKEFEELNPSISINAKFCNDKLFQLDMINFFNNDQSDVFAGRKKFYEYLDDNKAISDGFRINQKEESTLVSHSYIIDRNDSGGKIRGEEEIIVALYQSKDLFNYYTDPAIVDYVQKLIFNYVLGSANDNKANELPLIRVPLLEMRVSFKNKWFCPEWNESRIHSKV